MRSSVQFLIKALFYMGLRRKMYCSSNVQCVQDKEKKLWKEILLEEL